MRTIAWAPYSRLFVVGDEIGWSIDEDARFVTAAAQQLGYEVAPSSWARSASRQAVFLPSHFTALEPRWIESSHSLGLAYFHGRPGTPGYPEFDLAYERLRRERKRVARVQVTHAEMRDLVLEAGIEPERILTIPIGVDTRRFSAADAGSRRATRESFGVPSTAFVIGSFQKDGVGLGEGLEPKLVKGPDALLDTLERVHSYVPELFVLLTGLARGYVRSGLERLGIPHKHILYRSLDELARAYCALDAYLVTSRQEGGPKGPLEAMASGVPVVTTRVGQTQELVEDGRNGLLADVDDLDALAHAVLRIHGERGLAEALSNAGHETAAAYDHSRLIPEWASLLDGFVGRPLPERRVIPATEQVAPTDLPRRRWAPATRVAGAALVLALALLVLPETLGDWPYDPAPRRALDGLVTP